MAAAESAAKPFDYHSVRGRQAAVATSGVFEGESLELKGSSRVQGMKGFGPYWSGDAHLLWLGEPGEKMETAFRVPGRGRYKVSLQMTKAPDYGIFSVAINGKTVREGVDLFSEKVELSESVDLGEMLLEEGLQELTCTLSGANGKAHAKGGRQFLLGLDFVRAVSRERKKPDKGNAVPVHPAKSPRRQVSFEQIQPVFAKYCYRCHGQKGKVKGKVDLVKLSSAQAYSADPGITKKLLAVLEMREMPPDDELSPKEADYQALRDFTDGVISDHLRSENALPPVSLRRMNRYEYNNAVRDLLQLKGDVYPLPEKVIRPFRKYYDPASGKLPDSVHVGNRALGKNQIEQHLLTGVTPFAIDLQAEHGFNNRGDELGFSPILMESFLGIARALLASREFDGYSALTAGFFTEPEGLPRDEWHRLAEERLSAFLEKAFRAPLEKSTLARYLGLFTRAVDDGGGFELGMKEVVSAVLASPRFLYLLERKQGDDDPLNPYELATRLSFFLWSSIPDTELLVLAGTGRLSDPDVYRGQVKRMLLDRRSKALSENFARQWLRLDRLITAVPDFERFELYYSRIGCEQWKLGLQTMVEPLLLFESIMVEDRSVMLLVDSNYSYRTSDMASWYRPGVPFNGKGNRGRFGTNSLVYTRQAVNSRREGGVITCAATLAMNASPLRTSPITRGAWVADVIFNRPPLPPPDAVPEIEADDAKIEASGQTLRQRLVEHQVKSSCVSCHKRIDPLGFALENYDAVGRWRDAYRSGLAIDAGGMLFGKARFEDAVGLKDAILENPEWFLRGFSEHFLAYALGRELELADKPAVDEILSDAMATRGQFSVIVQSVASSYPFLHKAMAQNPVKQ
ncbi:MAG: DUF1592 domain-containing protein [Verrucomicrobiales bacterium]